jgi:GxxExxY protein
MKTKIDLIYAEECFQIMGIVFHVFKKLGFGHKEKVYQAALAREFCDKNIKYKEQVRYKLKYKGQDLGMHILDFLIFDKIILEIKRRTIITTKDIDQLYRYLKVADLRLGIIITFTSEGVRYKRVVNLR